MGHDGREEIAVGGQVVVRDPVRLHLIAPLWHRLVAGRADHGVHRDEQRELGQHRQASPEGVHAGLPVEAHRLFLSLLLVAFVLLLKVLDLRLQRLHRLHGLDLLHAQGEEEEAQDERQDDDRYAVVRDDVVQPSEDPSDRVEQPLEDRGDDRDLGQHQCRSPSSACRTLSYPLLPRSSSRGNRIEAALPVGVAASDAPQRHRATSDRPVLADRRLGVLRTRGSEPALAAEPPRQRRAVEADAPERHASSR